MALLCRNPNSFGKEIPSDSFLSPKEIAAVDKIEILKEKRDFYQKKLDEDKKESKERFKKYESFIKEISKILNIDTIPTIYTSNSKCAECTEIGSKICSTCNNSSKFMKKAKKDLQNKIYIEDNHIK